MFCFRCRREHSTVYGVSKLNEAHVFLKTPWTGPYGFLVFSSMPVEHVEAHFWLETVSLKDSVAEGCLHFYFRRRMDQAVTGEQVFGFQFPYRARLGVLNFSTGLDQLPVHIADQEAIFIEEPPKPPAEEEIRTTIVYFKFIASPEVSEYQGDLFFTWEGLIVKEGFSSYALTIPFANSEGASHKRVHESFPDAYIYARGMRIVVGLSLPEDSEFKGSITPPNAELIEDGLVSRRLLWAFDNEPIMGFGTSSSNFQPGIRIRGRAER